MTSLEVLSLAKWASCAVFLLSIAAVALIPVVAVLLAVVTALRHKFRSDGIFAWSDLNTALFSGRVSHTRFQPVTHAFSYPLFFCCLDLNEVSRLFRGSSDLWPLSLLMQFRDEDHLKNGEGLKECSDNSMHSRICRLVSERTGGKCAPGSEQRILLVTHLSYFGYCFNPVSFYYVLKGKKEPSDDSPEIEAVIAEVSNTPWNEMRCYVLHPDSKDITMVKPGRVKDDRGAAVSHFPSAGDGKGTESAKASTEGSSDGALTSVNYIFPKTFHVSPFMEMCHTYDWTFWTPRRDRIAVSTTMIKGDTTFFNAYFDIRRRPFHPLGLCWQLVRMPAYCAIIQIWIHVEAFRIFFKGVEFVPHPEGTETGASRVIGQMMAPFFAAKDWVNSWRAGRVDGDEMAKKTK